MAKRIVFVFVGLAAHLYFYGTSVVSTLKVIAANDAYTYFAQSITICRPYLTDSQTEVFESRFAALRSRSEYIRITDDLIKVAAANNLRLPEHKLW